MFNSKNGMERIPIFVSDLAAILIWWFWLLVPGLLYLPFVSRFSGHLFDHGYMLAKVLGVAIPAYGTWLLASLGCFAFTRATAFALLAGSVLWIWGSPHLIRLMQNILPGGFLRCKGALPGDFPDFQKRILCPGQKETKWSFIVFEEILFLAGLLIWAYVRGHNPGLWSLEKFMDFGFINAALNSGSMPPQDMWFAGAPINYYYFGHFFCAYLTRISGLEPAVTYNLMMATLFSLTFALTFSLAGNLVFWHRGEIHWKIPAAGFLAALLATLGSNLHTVIYACILPALGRASGSYYYPDATRFIGYNPDLPDKTIHEFPSYSFVVSDLHGHVNSLPFVLAFLLVLLTLSTLLLPRKPVRDDPAPLFLLQLLAAFFLALLVMTNTWDFPIYLVVAAMVILAAYLQTPTLPVVESFLRATRMLRNILLGCFLLASPFLLHFQNFSQGVGITHSRTPLYQLLILWGFYLPFILTYLYVLWRELVPKVSSGYDKIPINFPAKQPKRDLSSSDGFVLVMILASFGLILLPELVYVKDIYSADYYRANTMFKLTFQAAVMLPSVAVYTAVRAIGAATRAGSKAVATVLCLGLFSLPLLYPFWSLPGYYGSLKPGNYQGLNGLSFLRESAPGDWEAVNWLKERGGERPLLILEADGESYSDYGRISMATGYATILGWHVHQWLWRGSYDEVIRRSEEVALVYGGDNPAAARDIVEKYQVSYIILGELERRKYPGLQAERLLHLGPIVFESACGETVIIVVE